MLFKKSKKTPIITLGIGQVYVPGDLAKSPPPVQVPAEEIATGTLDGPTPVPDLTAAAPQIPAEAPPMPPPPELEEAPSIPFRPKLEEAPPMAPQPELEEVPDPSPGPVMEDARPSPGAIATAGDPREGPEPEPPPEAVDHLLPEGVSLAAAEPEIPAPSTGTHPADGMEMDIHQLFEAETALETIQCPFCLSSIPSPADICPNCGNQLHEPSPPADVPPEVLPQPADSDSAPAAEDGSAGLSDDLQPEPTRRLVDTPTPAVLRETTLFLPASLSLMDETDRDFTLKIGTNVLGREQSNDLAFPDEEFISRHHCEIRYHKYQYLLKDLNSANGTFVNDVRVQETTLRDGDVIQIGSMRFLFEDPVEKMKKKKAAVGRK